MVGEHYLGHCTAAQIPQGESVGTSRGGLGSVLCALSRVAFVLVQDPLAAKRLSPFGMVGDIIAVAQAHVLDASHGLHTMRCCSTAKVLAKHTPW